MSFLILVCWPKFNSHIWECWSTRNANCQRCENCTILKVLCFPIVSSNYHFSHENGLWFGTVGHESVIQFPKSFWKSNLLYKFFEDSLFVPLMRCLKDTEETWQNIELYLCVLFSSGNVIGILFTRHTKSVQSRGTASFPCHINPKRNRIENKIQSMIALQEKSIIQSWLLNLTTTFLYWSHLLFSAFQ